MAVLISNLEALMYFQEREQLKPFLHQLAQVQAGVKV